jgi:serine protease Do
MLVAAIPPASAAPPTSIERSIYRARDKVFPALVHIEPILEIFQSGERGRIAVTGSGVIFSDDGYVLTNNHVIERAERVTCTLSDKQEIPASVVGRDPETDVAVLKLDLSKVSGRLPVARLGDSSHLQIGQQVLAMGSPLGLARSVSLGVISSLDRYLPENQMPAGAATGQFNTWIQTDAAINPGNSGGPLVDLDGRVVGINSRAVTVFGENVGFAIPIDIVREVVEEIISSGGPHRSWLGVNWQPLTAISDAGEAPPRGVLVGGIAPDSPADLAGLRAGDVLVSFDGRPVAVRYEEELPPFRKLEADTPVGKRVELGILREGVPLKLSAITAQRKRAEGEDFECREWGLTVRDINEEIARNRNLEQSTGVIVTGSKRGSFAAEAELGPGLVIESVEGRAVPDLDAFERIYRELVAGEKDRVLIVTRHGVLLHYHLLKPTYEEGSSPTVEGAVIDDPGDSFDGGGSVPEGGGRGEN